jgi:hypothetical protein
VYRTQAIDACDGITQAVELDSVLRTCLETRKRCLLHRYPSQNTRIPKMMFPRQTGHLGAGLLKTHLAQTVCPQLPSTTLVARRSMHTGHMLVVGSLSSPGTTPKEASASLGCPLSTPVTILQLASCSAQ